MSQWQHASYCAVLTYIVGLISFLLACMLFVSSFRFVTVQQRLTYFYPIAGPTLVVDVILALTVTT